VLENKIENVDLAETQIVELSKRIDFYITEYSIDFLVDKMNHDEYVIPHYQREFTWEPLRQCRFIESVLLGLPIPFLFFWEMPTGQLEIVDGSQRLRTLQAFVANNIVLTGLEQLTLSSGYSFNDFSQSRQRKFKNRPIRGIVLNEHADEAARFDMFDRINTGSKLANNAEIRRGALAGPFLDLVVELSKDDLFCRLTPLSEKKEGERIREELVTRFFAYSSGLEGYRDRPRDFMFDFSKKMNEEIRVNQEIVEELRSRFSQVMTFVDQMFPYGFAKSAKSNVTYNARYEAIALGVFSALRDHPKLLNSTAAELNVESWLTGEEFTEVAGADGANAAARLRRRIEFVRGQLVNE
jgi:hypothetical protein